MNARSEAQDLLRRAGGAADAEIDVAETALALAALDVPDARFGRYRHHLSLLARDVADAFAEQRGEPGGPGDDLAARSSALSWVLTERYGYAGDRETYGDLQNANLMRVIDRRKGLPVALAVLYIHAARAQGWSLVALNFPDHLLMRLEYAGERAVLDPFDALAPRSRGELRGLLQSVAGPEAELAPEHTEALGNRDVLLRLHNNRKVRLLQDQRPEKAVQAAEAMLMLAPVRPGLWREAALLNAHLGNLHAAIRGFEQVLELSKEANQRREAAQLLEELRARIN